MTYGAECEKMKKKDERLTNKPELRMLRWRGLQGGSLIDHEHKKLRDYESGYSSADNNTPDAEETTYAGTNYELCKT